MSKRISKREEELFFGKSPDPAFDVMEKRKKIAAEIAETNRLINEAESFLKAENAGLEKVQNPDDVYFELLAAWTGFRRGEN